MNRCIINPSRKLNSKKAYSLRTCISLSGRTVSGPPRVLSILPSFLGFCIYSTPCCKFVTQLGVLLRTFFFFLCWDDVGIPFSLIMGQILTGSTEEGRIKTPWTCTLQTWHPVHFTSAEHYIILKWSTNKMIFGKSYLDVSLTASFNYIGDFFKSSSFEQSKHSSRLKQCCVSELLRWWSFFNSLWESEFNRELARTAGRVAEDAISWAVALERPQMTGQIPPLALVFYVLMLK